MTVLVIIFVWWMSRNTGARLRHAISWKETFRTSVDGQNLGIIPCLNSVCGNFFFRRCNISSDRGAAPVENRRKQDKSYSSTSGSRTSLMRIGGTRSNSLSWCLTTVSSMSFIVNAGSMYTSALIEMGRWRAWTRPVTGGLDYQL